MVDSLIKATLVLGVLALSVLDPLEIEGLSTDPSIHGRLQNLTGKGIANVSIILESDKFLYRTLTDEDGRYSFIVADGVYDLYIPSHYADLGYSDKNFVPDNCYSYFRPYHRRNITVSFPNLILLDLIVFESASLCNPVGKNAKNEMAQFFQWDHLMPQQKLIVGKLFPDSNSKDDPNISIQYGELREEKKLSVFSTSIVINEKTLFSGKPTFTALFYDDITVFAEKVVLESKRKAVAKSAFLFSRGKLTYFKTVLIEMDENFQVKLTYEK